MAPNKYKKPVKPLIHTPTRPKLLKKRSYLISTPFALAAKKARPKAVPQPTCISLLLRPKVSPFTPLLLASA